MKLYGATVSPFVRKVLVYAAERSVALENIPCPPHAEDPGFRAASPLGKIPCLQDGDYSLADSSAIIHYLEAKFPQGGLIPAEAAARGKVIWFEEYADSEIYRVGSPVFVNRVLLPKMMKIPGNEAAAAEAEKGAPAIFDYLEGVVPADGFLVGDSLTLADIAVASPLINLDYGGVQVQASSHPKLAAWFERVTSRSSFVPILTAERAMIGA